MWSDLDLAEIPLLHVGHLAVDKGDFHILEVFDLLTGRHLIHGLAEGKCAPGLDRLPEV